MGAAFYIFLTWPIAIIIAFAYILGFDTTKDARLRQQDCEMEKPKINTTTYPAELQLLKKRDTHFKEAYFLEYAVKVLEAIYSGTLKADAGILRPLETDHMYSIHAYQIEDLKAMKCYKDITIVLSGNVKIVDYRQDLSDEYIDVAYENLQMTSIRKLKNNKRIKDEKPLAEWTTQRLTFIRNKAHCTEQEVFYTVVCEKCGDRVDVVKHPYCPACGTKITMGNTGWLLDNLYQISEIQ
ncbi:MAG: TIM44-like domain-containing protein [Cellulosilyticaceae bacterium]